MPRVLRLHEYSGISGIKLDDISVYNHIYDDASRQRGIEFVCKGVRDRRLTARVDKVYPLADFRQAFVDHRQSKNRRGKLVITTRS